MLVRLDNNNIAVLLINFQKIYIDNFNFPQLENNFINYINYIRNYINPQNIIHIETFQKKNIFTNYSKPYKNEHILSKIYFDSFTDTNLRTYLNHNNINTIIICGLLTSKSILFTAQTAYCLGYKVYIYEPCSYDNNIEVHKNIINIYKNKIFEVIKNFDDFLFYSN